MNLFSGSLIIIAITVNLSIGQFGNTTPVFITTSPELKSVTVLAGADVTFICNVSTNNETSVKWSYNGITMYNCTEETNWTGCNFTTESVEASSDNGNYTCGGYDGANPFKLVIMLSVVPLPTLELLDTYTGHLTDSSGSGRVCIPLGEARFFSCTLHNITAGSSNITWKIGDEVISNSTVTSHPDSGTSGLVDIRSRLDVSQWADGCHGRVINLTCQSAGNELVNPMDVTLQLFFVNDYSKTLLYSLITFDVAFACAAVIFLMIIFKCDDNASKRH